MFLPSHRCLMPPSWGTPCDINAIYTSLKSAFSGLQFRRWKRVYLHSFSCYCLRNTRNVAKFRGEFDLTPYSSSRSSKVIHLGVNGKLICDFLLVIVTMAVSATVFEILTLKDRNLLILSTLPCLTPSLGGNRQNFGMKLIRQKLEGLGYRMVKIS